MEERRPAWRLYYGDGSTFSDLDGSWGEAPWRDVQALNTLDPDLGREVDIPRYGRNFYLWAPWAEKPWAVDWAGLMDFLLEVEAIDDATTLAEVRLQTLADHGVKLGRSINNHEFRDVLAAAISDPDFPTKSAFGSDEIPPGIAPAPLSTEG